MPDAISEPLQGEVVTVRNRGQLLVVGTGIQWASQMTLAAQEAIRSADRVLFAVADPWAARWIRELSPSAQSFEYARDGVPRRKIYAAMVARILIELEQGLRVCAAFYGNPAVLTDPAHDAIRVARAHGYAADMLPGVSFLDCLCADLGVDPGARGFQIYEATDLIVRKHTLDVNAHLVICQIGMIGTRAAHGSGGWTRVGAGLALLERRLAPHYGPDHRVIIYEAASQASEQARADTVAIGELRHARVSGLSSLYVPARSTAAVDEDMLEALRALEAPAG